MSTTEPAGTQSAPGEPTSGAAGGGQTGGAGTGHAPAGGAPAVRASAGEAASGQSVSGGSARSTSTGPGPSRSARSAPPRSAPSRSGAGASRASGAGRSTTDRSGRASTARPAARPKDPARRERIARAAISVVAERGIEKLTHRAVAAAAGVPLGSTTYYFANLDDLLAEALRQAAGDDVAQLREWARGLDPSADFAAALADLVLHYLGPERSRTVVEHELYVAALHRPALAHVSTEWDAALAEEFTAHTDPVTGKVLSALFCGLLLQGVVRESVPTRDEIETLFRRVLGPAEKS
ncbi:TetR family transcriptional regulator [Saccharopolyspora erythraea]|nr:TetR family transcriptional regulator [Saccharopolyspora erythraea]